MQNYLDKLRNYFWFSSKELVPFLIVVFGLSLIESWDLWGVQRFDFLFGLSNWLNAFLLVGITVFVHHAGQRMMALALGFRAEHRLWWNGLLFGLILAMLSGGNVKFLAATATMEFLLPIHRLGAFRHGANIGTLGKIALAGPVFNVLFAVLIKGLGAVGWLSPVVASQLFSLNIAFALWNLLPIPPLDGAKVFYWWRLLYFLLFWTFIVYAVLAWWLAWSSAFALPLALLIGVVLTIVWYGLIGKEWL
ncbi:hypothetical protein HY489_00170 [Candidatus Woesearchaeota archaeon]|nr:hypothetical protein [Candidatus Woesearchaeota archaeon]